MFQHGVKNRTIVITARSRSLLKVGGVINDRLSLNLALLFCHDIALVVESDNKPQLNKQTKKHQVSKEFGFS